MDTIELKEILMLAERLQKILEDSPEILKFMELSHERGTDPVVLPVKQDKLIGSKEAREILKVGPNILLEYEKRKLLTPLYTIKSDKKYWLSQIMALPQTERIA